MSKYNFVAEGDPSKETLLLLHGLFGTASNFEKLIEHFKKDYYVILPELPIFTMPLMSVSLPGLVKFLEKFIADLGLEKFHLIGNSLGGHLALLYVLEHPEQVTTMTLTASSGLYESAFGSSMPQRNNREFIEQKVKLTFYDPNIATDEMIDEVMDIVSDRTKAIRIIKMAKSAIRNNLEEEIQTIQAPTLLVWGNQDTITPPWVAEKFNELLPHSDLHMLDRCGHAPMLERYEAFNVILGEFLKENAAIKKEEATS